MSPGLADRIRACPGPVTFRAIPECQTPQFLYWVAAEKLRISPNILFALRKLGPPHWSKSSAFGEMEEEGCIVTIPTYSTKHEEGVKDGYTVPFPPH